MLLYKGVRGGGAAAPQFSQKYQLVRQFLLKSRTIFLFMFCFTNILNIFFSFVTCSMHKTHTKTQEMALKGLYFSKFSCGACPRTPLEVLAPSARVGQIRVRPPKISTPVHLCYPICNTSKSRCSAVAIVVKSTTKIFLRRLLQQKGFEIQRLRGMLHLVTSVARDKTSCIDTGFLIHILKYLTGCTNLESQ